MFSAGGRRQPVDGRVQHVGDRAGPIPGAELRTVPGGGHVYFWERPEIFNEMCLDFIARHEQA